MTARHVSILVKDAKAMRTPPTYIFVEDALMRFDQAFRAIESDSADRYEAIVASTIFDHLGEQGLLALPLLFDEVNAKKRTLAASTVLFANGQIPKLFDRKTRVGAMRVINDALQSSDDDLQCWTCALLSHGAIPNETVQPLRALVRSGDAATRLFAAIALCGCKAARRVALQAIRRALASDDPAICAVAAIGMVRMKIMTQLLDRVLDALPRMNDEGRLAVLSQLVHCGRFTPKQYDRLARVIANEELPPTLLSMAIRAAARVTPKPVLAQALLIDALTSSKWIMVDAAIDGLNHLGQVPDQAVQVLIRHLKASDMDLRRTAVRGLQVMGPRAADATAELINQGCQERNSLVQEELAAALGAIGPSTIPHLIRLLKGTDVVEHALATGALIWLGEAACVELARVLGEPGIEKRVRRNVFSALLLLLEDAEPAVPTIAAMLDEATDDDTQTMALAILFHCAPVAHAAVPALTRCLIRGDERLSHLAKKVLIRIGPIALPTLKQQLAVADNLELVRLEDVVARLEAGLESRLRYLSKAPPDLLEVFAVAGQIYQSEGGASRQTVARRITEMKAVGLLRGPAFESCSAGTVAEKISKLSRELGGVQILATSKGRKSALTDAGAALLEDVKAVVKWMHLSS